MSHSSARQSITALCDRIADGRRCARRLSKAVREHGLSEAEFRLLWVLWEEKVFDSASSVVQNDIVERTGASPAQVSALVEALREKRLIQSIVDKHDRRRQRWQFTEVGKASFERVVTQVSESFVAEILEQTSCEQIPQWEAAA